MADFGSLLKKLRAQHNMPQRDLAEKIGVDFTYISKIENERLEPPSEDVIIKMAEVFGVNKYDLILAANKIPSDYAWLVKVDDEVQKLLQQKVEQYAHVLPVTKEG